MHLLQSAAFAHRRCCLLRVARGFARVGARHANGLACRGAHQIALWALQDVRPDLRAATAMASLEATWPVRLDDGKRFVRAAQIRDEVVWRHVLGVVCSWIGADGEWG